MFAWIVLSTDKPHEMAAAKTIAALLLVVFVSACAKIPQASVDASNLVGIGLKKQHQSQVDLVNLHFATKRKSLDSAMEKAMDRYFAALTPSGSITLTRSQLSDVAADVMNLNAKNNAAKEELEKARVWMIKYLNENYLLLNQANASITGMLQSAISVASARSEASGAVANVSGGALDFDGVFDEIDAFVLKGGEAAGKTIALVDIIQDLVDAENERKETK